MFERHLKNVVKEISDCLETGITWQAIADGAGLSVSTVWNLINSVTKEPRYSTVWKMAKLIGYEMTLVETKQQKRKTA